MAEHESGSGEQPIIIKKVVKGGHGHHGGAWKVAYADFVTAMMAFFIVMWILSAGQSAKEEVAAYFNDPGAFSFITGKRAIAIETGLKPEPGKTPGDGKGEGADGKSQVLVRNPSKSDIIDGIRAQARMDSARAAKRVEETGEILQEFIDQMAQISQEFEKLSKSIEFQLLDEGLRIELIESSDNTFFQVGSANLRPEVTEILEILAQEIGKLPNFIELEGHTDARGYGRTAKYTNWELSSDRANAARRVMTRNGLWDGQVLRVAGYADKFLRYPEQPFDPKNRRISILIKHLSVSDFKVTEEEVSNAE